MQLPIEDMIIRSDGATQESLYGSPLHADASAILELYRTSSEKFLAVQARHGIGNYALVDQRPGLCRVITSPGYCGGYFHAGEKVMVVGTALDSVLAHVPQIEFDPFGLCFYLTPHPKSAWSQLPTSSLFQGVRRLPPASIIEFADGRISRFESYLLKSSELGAPASFEAAMMEVANALAIHYKGTNPTVMFSGGVDSLAIYLALAEAMDPKDLRVVTFQTADGRSKTNGPARAHPIASRLGMNVEYIPDHSLTSAAVTACLKKMMHRDLIGTRSPHLAFADHDFAADIIHGQNMDATVMLSMTVLQKNWERGYLSAPQAALVDTDTKRLEQYDTFVSNLQFTTHYLSDVAFQRITARHFARLTDMIVDPNPGGAGILRGLLSSQYPNLLLRPKSPASIHSMVANLNREAAAYSEFVGPDGLKPGTVANLARYYTYSHIAAKRLSTFPLHDGSRVQLLAMAGPILSYYAGRPRRLRDASRPKSEVYGFVRKLTGRDYSELAVSSGVGAVPMQSRKESKSTKDLILSNSPYSPDNSLLLDLIPDPKSKRYVERLYRNAPNGIARQLINLEFILSNAAALSREAKAGARRKGGRSK